MTDDELAALMGIANKASSALGLLPKADLRDMWHDLDVSTLPDRTGRIIMAARLGLASYELSAEIGRRIKTGESLGPGID